MESILMALTIGPILNFIDLSQISEAYYEFENFPMLIKWRKKSPGHSFEN